MVTTDKSIQMAYMEEACLSRSVGDVVEVLTRIQEKTAHDPVTAKAIFLCMKELCAEEKDWHKISRLAVDAVDKAHH